LTARDEKSITAQVEALAENSSRLNESRLELLLCNGRRVLGFRAAFTGSAAAGARRSPKLPAKA
jgi:hypothetical protein